MRMIRISPVWIVTGLLAAGITTCATLLDDSKKAVAFHTEKELAAFKAMGASGELTEDFNEYFTGSGNCSGCHGLDEQGNALVDEDGNDVNMTDDWRSTMMANSARDPFWRAKVSHEILVNPGHQTELEDKCTSCHAPQGHFNAHMTGQLHYSIAEMEDEPVALDGVSCLGCHQISPDSVGETFSGIMKYDTNKVAYGPYQNPFGSPMFSFVGVEPRFSEHITKSESCASCHTLLTNTVNLEGETTGDQFVEQATYHEWLNSIYNGGETNQECQGCHMPRIDDEVQIASGINLLPARSPYGLHELVGGNVFMLDLMKDNIGELGLTASEAQFQNTIDLTYEMLQENTLELTLDSLTRDADTARFALSITNLAGHKFPSGYPARRAFVNFVVQNDDGDTLFVSGDFDELGDLPDQVTGVEPHYKMINSESQVQVYELVLGDVENNLTTVLERADTALKDNRIPPAGFSTEHFAYDTTRIYGEALSDADFNFDSEGNQGTGADSLFFHVPVNGYTGELAVTARVYYQAVPRRWLLEMFEYNSEKIDQFRDMFEEQNHEPVLVKQALLGGTSGTGNELTNSDLKVWPNPTSNGMVFMRVPSAGSRVHIRVFDTAGKLLLQKMDVPNQEGISIRLPQEPGVYFLELRTPGGSRAVQRVVRQ